MRALDIIIKKRDQGELSRREIEFFIKGFTDGEIPDYQASALAVGEAGCRASCPGAMQHFDLQHMLG
jgi:thymidine phosphorylase